MVKRRYQPKPEPSVSDSDFSSPSPPRNARRESYQVNNNKSILVKAEHGISSKDSAPLRRGAACLMCRAKKLKCSATKPKCDQCSRREDKCIYDAARPASRVEQLARKLAEIEAEDRQAAIRLLAERRRSDNAALAMTPQLAYSEANDAPLQPVYTYGNMFTYGQSSDDLTDSYNSMATTQVSSGSNSPINALPQIQSNHNNSNSNNNGVNWDGWNGTNGISRNGMGTPSEVIVEPDPFSFSNNGLGADSRSLGGGGYPYQQSTNMPWNLLHSSSDISSKDWGLSVALQSQQALTASHLQQPISQTQSHQSFNHGEYTFQNVSPPLQTFAYPTAGPSIATPIPIFPTFFDPSVSFAVPDMATGVVYGGGGIDIPRAKVENVVGPFDTAPSKHGGAELGEEDISQSAKDYLLDLFFSPPREAFGTEVFSEAQFKSRMEGPVEKRCHPCLLFAIYTEASSSSFIPAVRALADSLYQITARKIGESIKSEDRILDAMRACKMLGKWSFGRARALEGYTWTEKSVSLALACQLDKIPSSIFDPCLKVGDNPWPILGPPESQWELCERIHAFWSIWANEKGSSIITRWPSNIRDDQIVTPLPRNPQDYLDGSIRMKADIRLRDVYNLSPELTSKLDYKYHWTLTAVHLVHRARTLDETRPETAPTYRLSSRPRSEFETIRDAYPKQYQEMMETMDHLQSNLPREFEIDYMSNTPWAHKDVPLVHACLLTARMHLHKRLSLDETDLNESLSSAMTQIRLLKRWTLQLQTDDLKAVANGPTSKNANGGMRHRRGIAGPYMLICWFKTVEVLREGAGILRGLNRVGESADCVKEVEDVVAGLRGMGVNVPL